MNKTSFNESISAAIRWDGKKALKIGGMGFLVTSVAIALLNSSSSGLGVVGVLGGVSTVGVAVGGYLNHKHQIQKRFKEYARQSEIAVLMNDTPPPYDDKAEQYNFLTLQRKIHQTSNKAQKEELLKLFDASRERRIQDRSQKND